MSGIGRLHGLHGEGTDRVNTGQIHALNWRQDWETATLILNSSPTAVRRKSRLDEAGHSHAQTVFINFAALRLEGSPKEQPRIEGPLDMCVQKWPVLLAT
jgi:hypothetical protein